MKQEINLLFAPRVLAIIAIIISVCHLISTAYWGGVSYNHTVLDAGVFFTLIFTILGICISMILGYQIFNMIEVRQDIKELQSVKDKIQNDVASSMYYNAYTIGRVNMLEKAYERAFRAYNNSLIYLVELDDIDTKLDTILGYMSDCVRGMSETMQHSSQCEKILVEVKKGHDFLVCHENFVRTSKTGVYEELVNKFTERLTYIIQYKNAVVFTP